MPTTATNKVTFGLSELHLAPMTTEATETGNPTYGTVVALPGGVHLTYSPQSNDYTFHADNGAYFSGTYNGNGYEGDLEVALIPDALLAQFLGWAIDAKGGISEIADAKPVNFAMGFQVEGDVAGRRTWFYNCTMGRPDGDHSTTDDNIEVATQTAPVRMLPTMVSGQKITKYSLERTTASATVYDGFFESVTFPQKSA